MDSTGCLSFFDKGNVNHSALLHTLDQRYLAIGIPLFLRYLGITLQASG
jgi:hypothetical protein